MYLFPPSHAKPLEVTCTWLYPRRAVESCRLPQSVRVAKVTSPATLSPFSPRSGILIAIVDTGPLFAVADSGDRSHAASLEVLERPDLTLVVPTMVVAEATYLVATRLGATAEATFLRGISSLEIEAPEPDEWTRIAELVETYSDLPLGGTDAAVVSLAERLGASTIVTLDRKHFSVVRPSHVEAFELLPAA